MYLTRETEIEQQAFVYYETCSDEDIAKSKGFIDGAKWADKHPSVDTVKKIICYALKYTNIMLSDDLGNGVEWELLIKKAMEQNGKVEK